MLTTFGWSPVWVWLIGRYIRKASWAQGSGRHSQREVDRMLEGDLKAVSDLLGIAVDPVLWERERKMFYLTTHSTHFIYGYMASDIWLRTILIVRKETLISKGSFICTIPQTG